MTRASQSATLTGTGEALHPDLVPVLHVLHSPDRRHVGQARTLGHGDLTLGRDGGDADWVFDDGRMSRQHAQLRASRQRLVYLLEDTGSKNGLFVNGGRTAARALEDGDIVRIGDTLLAFECVDPVLAEPENHGAGADLLLGDATVMRRLRRELEVAAPSNETLYLHGETGSGKEVAASLIHRLSGRKGAFVPVNCGAIPSQLVESTLFGHRRGAFTGATDHADGLVVAADRGTLFLDEVAELAPPAQASLLRVLEDGQVLPVGGTTSRRVDVRVVAASHVELRQAVAEGRFRADLVTRIGGWVVRIPPLRQRRRDILSLCRHFLRGPMALSADAAEALCIAPWPGNVREVRTTLGRARALAAGGEIALAHLPDELQSLVRTRVTVASTAPESEGRPSREELLATLQWAQGNVSKVAERHGRTRKQIYRWLEHYGVDLGQLRGGDGKD